MDLSFSEIANMMDEPAGKIDTDIQKHAMP